MTDASGGTTMDEPARQSRCYAVIDQAQLDVT